jgi:cytochrome P450
VQTCVVVINNALTLTHVALRVFPPVPVNCRFAVQTTTLPHGGGDDGEAPVLIPKGTLVAFSTFATHRFRKLYGDDANIFRIDRWLDDAAKEKRLTDWSYHPFIGGPRKCLGGK